MSLDGESSNTGRLTSVSVTHCAGEVVLTLTDFESNARSAVRLDPEAAVTLASAVIRRAGLAAS